MKINFGTYKGRVLKTAKDSKMKPTSSMAKSSIFNMIDVKDKNVLDLFAGTGALGFESLSLGAANVIWTDTNINAVKAIKENIDMLEIPDSKREVFKSDFRMTLRRTKDIDVLFMDPPFTVAKYYEDALKMILDSKVLNEDGIIVMEKNNNISISNLLKFVIIKEKRLGNMSILILKKADK